MLWIVEMSIEKNRKQVRVVRANSREELGIVLAAWAEEMCVYIETIDAYELYIDERGISQPL